MSCRVPSDSSPAAVRREEPCEPTGACCRAITSFFKVMGDHSKARVPEKTDRTYTNKPSSTVDWSRFVPSEAMTHEMVIELTL